MVLTEGGVVLTSVYCELPTLTFFRKKDIFYVSMSGWVTTSLRWVLGLFTIDLFIKISINSIIPYQTSSPVQLSLRMVTNCDI